MKHFKQLFCVFSTSILIATSSSAHHGQDFLIAQDVHLPAPGKVHFIGNFEWESYNDGDDFGYTPGLMVGVMDRLALAVDVHFRDERTSDLGYSNVMPMADFDLTPTSDKFPFKIGLTAGYQFAGNSAEEPAMHHEEAGHDDHHADEAESGHEHTHSGSIHNHDSDAFNSRLIIETNIGDTKLVANLIALAGDGSAAWGYSFGARHKLNHLVAVGGEAMGDFDSQGWQELVAGLYLEPCSALTFRIGAGFGLTDATPDFTLRTGFVLRF